MLGDGGEDVHARRRPNHVDVVEDEHEGTAGGVERSAQAREHARGCAIVWPPGSSQLLRLLQRADQVTGQQGDVVVRRSQREPPERTPVLGGPLLEQRALPEPGAGDDQHDARFQ